MASIRASSSARPSAMARPIQTTGAAEPRDFFSPLGSWATSVRMLFSLKLKYM